MGNPTVTPIQEALHAGGYVIWEPENGMVCRDSIILKSGNGVLTAGLVLAALEIGAGAVAAALGTNTGNGTFGAITVATSAKIGDYTVEFDDATHYVVTSPAGKEVGHGTTGSAYSAGGLGFTITAGGTAFVPGDSFTVTVSLGSGAVKYVPYDPTATDGSQNAAAVLFSGRRDTTSADQKAVAHVRGPCRLNIGELVWGANVTTGAHKSAAYAALAALGIQVS